MTDPREQAIIESINHYEQQPHLEADAEEARIETARAIDFIRRFNSLDSHAYPHG